MMNREAAGRTGVSLQKYGACLTGGIKRLTFPVGLEQFRNGGGLQCSGQSDESRPKCVLKPTAESLANACLPRALDRSQRERAI
jgi:hypothetical protein